MASSPVFESDFLQQRFNERKAESSRTNKHHEQQSARGESPHRRLTAGRDDAIFDDPDTLSNRRTSSRLYQSSPAGPSGRLVSHSRRTSNMAASVSSTHRAMGAREKEDIVDKLSKQNFDLKLEVYHRREKIEELEKKLVEMQQLQDENAELSDINQELLQELDKRDRAVDEAVVMICDLEETVRSQQEALDETRPRTARQQTPQESWQDYPRMHSSPQQRRRVDSSGEQRNTSIKRTSVSPDVSARMAELAIPRQTNGHSRQSVPSFIQTGTATTDALRSMYIQNNKQVRPIPSHASLLSQSVNNDDDFMDGDDDLLSPALSELSESDFKSLYGKDERTEEALSAPYETSQDLNIIPDPPTHSTFQPERSRLARTNRWVKERAVSPAQRPRATSRQASDQFQSLGGVLHDADSSPERTRKKRAPKVREDSTITAIHQNPTFGHNHFPPTPDTMLTGPSNKSSSSFIRGRSHDDSGAPHNKGALTMLPTQRLDKIPTAVHGSEYFARGSLLPKDADAYASDEDTGRRQRQNLVVSNNSFGDSLYQPDGYNSDSGAPYVRPGKRRGGGNSSAAMFDSSDMGAIPATRSGASPPRISKSRQLPKRPMPVAIDSGANLQPEKPEYGRRRSISVTPTQPSFLQSQQDAASPDAGYSTTPTQNLLPRQPQSDVPVSRRIHLPARRPSTPPNNSSVSKSTETTAVASAPSRADSLRQRVANLTRRNSASNSSAGAAIKSDSGSAPPSTGGNLGRRTRQLFRRNSKSKGSEPSAQDGRNGSAIESDNEGAGSDVRVKEQYMTPANKGIPTTIPIFSPTPSSKSNGTNGNTNAREESRERSVASSLSWRTAASGTKATPDGHLSSGIHETSISPTLASASARPRRESGGRAFPKRGTDGKGYDRT